MTLSFTRQYPSWLFPGQDERDPDYAGHLEPGVDYCISPYRVASWFQAVRRLRRAGVEQVVLPWWTAYWSLCFGFLAWRLRRAGIRVTFLCHNVRDHEHSWLSARAASLVLRLGDDYLVHSQRQRAQLRALHGPVSVKVHPHPIHTHFPPARGLLHRRAGLELLFYGFVRPYKGVDVLLEALARCPDLDYDLTIAGEIRGGKTDLDAAVRAAGLEQRVEVRPHYPIGGHRLGVTPIGGHTPIGGQVVSRSTQKHASQSQPAQPVASDPISRSTLVSISGSRAGPMPRRSSSHPQTFGAA